MLICDTGNLWSKFRAAYPNSLLSKKKKQNWFLMLR